MGFILLIASNEKSEILQQLWPGFQVYIRSDFTIKIPNLNRSHKTRIPKHNQVQGPMHLESKCDGPKAKDFLV